MQSAFTKHVGSIPIKGNWLEIKQYIKGYQRANYMQGKIRPNGWSHDRAFLQCELELVLAASGQELLWTWESPGQEFYWI